MTPTVTTVIKFISAIPHLIPCKSLVLGLCKNSSKRTCRKRTLMDIIHIEVNLFAWFQRYYYQFFDPYIYDFQAIQGTEQRCYSYKRTL